jgi:hypothetical protein
MKIASCPMAFAATVLSLLATGQAMAQTGSTVDTDCILKGFIAQGTAREAFVRNLPLQHWRVQPNTSEYQYSFLDELYRRKEEGLRDFDLFGAEKLLQCLRPAATAELPPAESLITCFAEIDVVLHARQYKAGGGGLAGTKRFARYYLKDAKRYPQEMFDRVIPKAFALDDPERLQAYREALMQSCASAKLR